MATLIPALGSCVSRMTPGERRTAERLEQKLDADYLLWYDVAVGHCRRMPVNSNVRRQIEPTKRSPGWLRVVCRSLTGGCRVAHTGEYPI
jgi:hypothetical protein